MRGVVVAFCPVDDLKQYQLDYLVLLTALEEQCSQLWDPGVTVHLGGFLDRRRDSTCRVIIISCSNRRARDWFSMRVLKRVG